MNNIAPHPVTHTGTGAGQEAPGSEHKKAPAVSEQRLEDWAYRLQSAADEAQDARLRALESDLLDLRDEITFALHSAT